MVCAGAWSKKLTNKLGENVPLASERGYHIMYSHPENSISRPIAWQERGVYFTPMQDGIRAGGVVEFGGNSLEISPNVINYLKRASKAVFPELDNHFSEWVGLRPSVPDSSPVIGQSKKKSLYLLLLWTSAYWLVSWRYLWKTYRTGNMCK